MPGPDMTVRFGSLVGLTVTVAAMGLSGCLGAPEQCRGCLAALADAGPYVAPRVDAGVGTGGGVVGTGGVTGSGGSPGTGGSGSGGMLGTGGTATGGAGTGGMATGGAATGGMGTGGAATGGMGTGGMGTGGMGTGGAATGGAGTGGVGTGGAATGGMGTGGSATGGRGTGGAGTGGMGTGGAATGGAGARIISIDFVGGLPGTGGAGGTTLTPVPMAATETAGVKLVANWNSAATPAGTRAALLASDGLATTASVTWSAPAPGEPGIYGIGYTNTAGNARMMNGYLDPTSPTMPATIAVTGLPPSITTGGYDVYVYVAGNMGSGTRTYQYAIGALTATVTQIGPAPPMPATFPGFTAVPSNNGAGNYVVFRNLTGASFTLTATPPSTGFPRAPVNGLQIVSPTGS